jgi:hypothetical protein
MGFRCGSTARDSALLLDRQPLGQGDAEGGRLAQFGVALPALDGRSSRVVVQDAWPTVEGVVSTGSNMTSP